MDFDLNIALGLDDLIERDNITQHVTNEDIDANNVFGDANLDGQTLKEEVVESESREKCTTSNSPAGTTSSRDGSGGKGDENIKIESIRSEIEKRLVVGSAVDDLEQVYLLYCEYARCNGFSVRRGEQRYIGKTDELRWKEYVCSCAGVPDEKRSKHRVACYKKLVTRTGCKAKIRVSRVSGGTWRVTTFETSHNHSLVAPERTYLLRSSRKLSYATQSVLEALHSVGIGVSRVCRFMERESGGPENVGFTRQDAYDHIKVTKKATKLENGDATALMEYFIEKSNAEPFFYWKVQLDDDRRIMNFFFRDSRSADDYHVFGDVMCVDTTYRTNRYNLICAPFVGINHHTSNVMFGMAFMSDETTSTFEWLFRSFLESMNGVEPKVIFTDQCQAMMNAIDSIFPNSKHRLCQWHINQNAPSHFGSLNGNASFKKLWHKCMNGVETESEFEEVWNDMMNSYNLKENKWFGGMYRLRKRWASVFSNGLFTAGVHATTRSELTNKVLKDLNCCSTSLYDFVRKYEEIQLTWRRKEAEEDTFCLFLPGQFVSENPLLIHAATVYTRSVYKIFESEATKSFNVIVTEDRRDLGGGNLEFHATSAIGSKVRTIVYNRDTHVASCTCQMLESDGIFCRHILKVFYIMNVFGIPESCILKRWTKRAKDISWVERNGGETRSTLPYLLFLNNVMRHVYDLASSGMNNDSARSLIIDRVDSLRRDVYAIVGLREIPAEDKVKSNEKKREEFCDPQPVKDRGFIFARRMRDFENKKRKGKNKSILSSIGNTQDKKLKTTPTTSKLNTSLHFMDLDSTMNEEVNEDCVSGDVIYWDFTQPQGHL